MEIRIEGLDALFRKLQRLEKIEDALRPWAERTLKAAEKYTNYSQTQPARLPGQKYIRTFELRSGWQNQITVQQGSIIAKRYNNRTPYGLWVMGRRTQTRIFAGRWPTDEGIEQAIAPAALKDLQQTIWREIDK